MNKKGVLIVVAVIVIALLLWWGLSQRQDATTGENTEAGLETEDVTNEIDSLDTGDIDKEFMEVDKDINSL